MGKARTAAEMELAVVVVVVVVGAHPGTWRGIAVEEMGSERKGEENDQCLRNVGKICEGGWVGW